ncbi:MAG: Spy/CpxP family protein refolding chaperone [Polyangiaceae bacterium]|nr:Spy/CpxP family protein refolding chaperone [Polyangiaceae bacterium]
MKFYSFARSLAFASFAVVAVGCGGQTEQAHPQTQAGAGALTKAPVGANTHGFVKVVGTALGEVPLRPDQRAELEALASQAESRHAVMAAEHKDLMNALADQVEKGSIDRAALQPKIDRLSADWNKAHPEDRAAFTRIHDLLDSTQRNAFVDALEAQFNATGARGAKGGEGGGYGPHHGFQRMADDLKLTEAQRAQIKDIMKSSHPEWQQGGAMGGMGGGAMKDGGAPEHMRRMHEGHRRVLEAFRTDKFDANALGSPDEHMGDMAMQMGSRGLDDATKILPILTPDQRKIAAEKIRTAEMGLFGH